MQAQDAPPDQPPPGDDLATTPDIPAPPPAANPSPGQPGVGSGGGGILNTVAKIPLFGPLFAGFLSG